MTTADCNYNYDCIIYNCVMMAIGTELGLQTNSTSIFLPIASKNTQKMCLQRTKCSIENTM